MLQKFVGAVTSGVGMFGLYAQTEIPINTWERLGTAGILAMVGGGVAYKLFGMFCKSQEDRIKEKDATIKDKDDRIAILEKRIIELEGSNKEKSDLIKTHVKDTHNSLRL